MQKYIEDISNCLPKKVTNKTLKEIKQKCNFYIYGFCNIDLSSHDFSSCKLEEFSTINFNSNTIFPKKENLPQNFNTNYLADCLNLKKNNLHTKPCTLAIIDNPAKLNHNIYKNANIKFIPYQKKKDELHFHLDGVLSNILLKYNTNNVKFVVYTHSWKNRAKDNLKALKDIEKKIKKGENIFAVSISDWLMDKARICPKMLSKLQKQVEKLNKLNCTVIDSQKASQTNVCQAYFNLNTKNIELGYFRQSSKAKVEKNLIKNDKILMLASPIYADSQNENGYIADFCPGFSWIIPQIAYLFVFAKTEKNLSYNQFCQIVHNSFTLGLNDIKIFSLEKFKAILKN